MSSATDSIIPSETPTSVESSQISRRPGGRSARVLERVLDATSQELREHGYLAMSFERVAEKAGVNKSTIYRRWPTKRHLVESLVASLSGDLFQAPNTGSIVSDLLLLAQSSRDRSVQFHRQGLARVFALQIEHPDIKDIGAVFREQLREPWFEALRVAVARGELHENTDVALVVEVIVSTIALRVVKEEREANDLFLKALVNLVLDGVRRQEP